MCFLEKPVEKNIFASLHNGMIECLIYIYFEKPVDKNIFAPLPSVAWQMFPPAHMLDVTRESGKQ